MQIKQFGSKAAELFYAWFAAISKSKLFKLAK